jgi:D-alanine-D-alanine ligase
MDYEKIRHIVVLKGGCSDEREVSLVSGNECGNALRSIGYEVSEIDAKNDVVQALHLLKPDAVFNALHGRWGEDGCVQGILEWMKIPYTHSGVLSSALAMDKERTKAVYRSVGLPCATSIIISADLINDKNHMKPPYVVKPINGGSSLGVSFVCNSETNETNDYTYNGQVMLEEFIPGRELTVTVLDEIPLTVTEIITDNWYDYDAKYTENGSLHEVPANLPNVIFDACKQHALSAHLALGCRGVSRTDFRWDDTKGILGLKLLETNTQPGMCPTSLTPEQAEFCGVSFENLCQKLIQDASCDR